MSEPGTDLVLPSGELVALDDTAACVRALDELRDLESRIKELKGVLTDAIKAESTHWGGKTLTLPGGIQATIKNDNKVYWDAQLLESKLREAGMPEERIRQIVVEEVSWSVQAVEAKKAAAANPDYAACVEAARTVVAARPTISVKRL